MFSQMKDYFVDYENIKVYEFIQRLEKIWTSCDAHFFSVSKEKSKSLKPFDRWDESNVKHRNAK